MLTKKFIKKLFLGVLVLVAFQADAQSHKISSQPTANAGPDQRIYLTQTSGITLDGSSSLGKTYLWTDISTDYKSGAVINSPTSLITKVTGLKQGTWYYQLAVKSKGNTARDTVVVRVDYDVPPANSTLIRELPITNPGFIKAVNIRDDTTKFWGYTNDPGLNHTRWGIYIDKEKRSYNVLLDRGHLPNMMIDSARGKLYATVQDGWPWAERGAIPPAYARTELSFGKGKNGFDMDTSKTYVFEWKGYFPQKFDFITHRGALAIFQLKPAKDSGGTLFQYSINSDGRLTLNDNINGKWNNNKVVKVANLSDFYNQTHTIRTTMKEGRGFPGQSAFIKVELDGVQKYLRDTGVVGTSINGDGVKFGGIYDFNNSVVHADSLSRGRSASIVTEEFRIYQLNNNRSPEVNGSSGEIINLPESKINHLGKDASSPAVISSK